MIVQRYSAWVWADTMTLIDGSSRLAMSAMALPARLPAQPLSAGGAALEAALVDDEHDGVDALAPAARATARLAASASSWKVRPATPVGVTIVGVASSTSPMKPTSTFVPLPDLNRLMS